MPVGYAARMALQHPAVPLKTGGSRVALARHQRTDTAADAAKVARRQADNVARLYARRMIELAALAAANAGVVHRTKMEPITKPSQWGTIDLEEQRREFGENMSSLGGTKIERVWAAGEQERGH